MKAPYTLVIGDKEIAAGNFNVRDRSGAETKGVGFDELVRALHEEIETRSLEQRSFGD
jgi:threonyl-tRNA synthetase